MALDIANCYPLLNNRATNDSFREGTLILEPFEVTVTIASNTGDVEVPTQLTNCLGVINMGYMSIFEAGDSLTSMSTDGVITSGAVTVRVVTVSIPNGDLVVRGILVGTKEFSRLTITGAN